jgi:iron complex transport system substrate-binding protein
VRIASLQPSITITLAALGALDTLCAHTKYCLEALPQLMERGLPVLADSWTTTTDEITATQPDLVIASVPYRMESLAAILKAGLPLLALAPHTLSDVAKDTRLLAAQVDRRKEGEALIAAFEQSIAQTRAATANLPRLRVYSEEWGRPLIHSQPWIEELISEAGGDFVGQAGQQTTPDHIAGEDPDVLLFAWCGAGDRVPLERVIDQRGWRDLRAVRARNVFCIPDEYLNTPAIPSLERGLAYLVASLHPDGLHAVRPVRLGD